MRFILGLVLTLTILFPVFADGGEELIQHKVTGTVVSDDDRYKNAAIVDDKIWFQGDKFLVEDGKILYKIVPGENVDVLEENLAKLVLVENSKVHIEYRGVTYTFKAR